MELLKLFAEDPMAIADLEINMQQQLLLKKYAKSLVMPDGQWTAQVY